MTPNKAKKPLPSSTSMIIPEPEQPQTSREWKTALQRVRFLYLKNQWKPCLARCEKLLEGCYLLQPLYVACLHFYAALSNEAIARLAHNLSTTKIPLLEQAKKSYQAASRIMPALEDPLNEQRKHQHSIDTPSEGSSPSPASSSSDSTPVPSRPSSPNYPSSSASSTGSVNDIQLQPEAQQEPHPLTPSPSLTNSLNLTPSSPISTSSLTPTTESRLRPSPLRIPKPTPPIYNPSTTIIPHPTTPPAQIFPSDLTTTTTNRPLSVTFSTSSTLWLQNRAVDRYHGHLIAFANMLIAHVEAVDHIIQSTEEAQTNRLKLRRFVSGGLLFGGVDGCGKEDEEVKGREEVKGKIELGKERGWRRERFAPERYQELCARALGEL